MSRIADWVIAVAARLGDREQRARRREEWSADVRDAAEIGVQPNAVVLGAIRSAVHSTVRDRLLRRRTAVTATALIAAGALVLVLTPALAPQPIPTSAAPICGRSARSIAVVAPTTRRHPSQEQIGSTIDRAHHVLQRPGLFEGVWLVPSGELCVGVSGTPTSADAAAFRRAVAPTDVGVTFVTQPVSEHQLHVIQDALPWPASSADSGVVFSDIDVVSATVTATVGKNSPAGLERRLETKFGPRLVVTRATSDIYVDFRVGTGRMPLASGSKHTAR